MWYIYICILLKTHIWKLLKGYQCFSSSHVFLCNKGKYIMLCLSSSEVQLKFCCCFCVLACCTNYSFSDFLGTLFILTFDTEFFGGFSVCVHIKIFKHNQNCHVCLERIDIGSLLAVMYIQLLTATCMSI